MLKYRVTKDGTFEFHTFSTNQKFNTNVWGECNFAVRETVGQDGEGNDIYGEYFKFYKLIDGVYIPDFDKIQADTIVKDLMELKVEKNKQLEKLIVITNTVPFDADSQSINYMSSVLAIANFKMLQVIASGTNMTDAYSAIYKTIIQWKNADDSISDVQLETIAEALEAGMQAIGSIKTKS